MKKSEKHTVIGLLDHMGWGNLGDAATQDVVIKNVAARLPNVRFIGFSLVPEDTEKRHNIPCFPIRWSYPTLDDSGRSVGTGIRQKSRIMMALKKNRMVSIWARPLSAIVREAHLLLKSYRILRNLDVLIISGGGQLDDLWPGQPYNILKFCLLAKIARRNVILLNVGVAALRRRSSRIFASWVIRLADYRSVRDFESRERVRKLGVRKAVHVYPDLVYALKLDDRIKVPSGSSSGRVVGLNPLGYCDPRIWPRKDSMIYQKYLDKIGRFCVWLLEQGYKLQLFSTDLAVDRYAIDDLKTALARRFAIPPPVFERTRGASDSVTSILSEMADCDYVVTSKYHGLIFSHLLGIPVISLSYESKMDAAMAAVGLGSFSSHVETFEVDWLIAAFQTLISEGRSIRAHSSAAAAGYSTDIARELDGLFPGTKSNEHVLAPMSVGCAN